MLPKWVKLSKERFNEILSTITEPKNNGFKINVDGNEITLDNAESVLKDQGSGKIGSREFKKVQQYCWWCRKYIKDAKAYKKSNWNDKNFITAKRDGLMGFRMKN